jgi:hypothetical protein
MGASLLKQGSDELRRVEGLKVFDFFSDTDVPDGNPQFFLNADDYATLSCAVEFGQYDAGNICCFFENAGLLETVLSRRGIQHQKGLMGGIRLFSGNNPADLFQFLDQMDFCMKSSRRVDEQDVGTTTLGRLNAIINYCGRIGAGPMFDHVDAHSFCPCLELLDGGRTKGIRSHQENFLPG